MNIDLYIDIVNYGLKSTCYEWLENEINLLDGSTQYSEWAYEQAGMIK